MPTKQMDQLVLNEALIIAAEKGEIDKVRALIKSGADVNAKNASGWTALYAASSCDHVKIVEFLIKNSANINAKTNNGRTALHKATTNNHIKIVKLLIENSMDVNAKDNDGWTALHEASYNDYTEIAMLLIENGADPDIKNNRGNTALDIIAKSSNDKDIENSLKIAKQNLERHSALNEIEEQLAHRKRMHDALRRSDVSTMSNRDFLNMLESEIADKK